MKNFINPRQTLKTLTIAGATGLLAVSQAGFAQNQAASQTSASKDGAPVWDMAFVAIDTNDDKVVDWSEISRHYNRQLTDAGWGENEVLNRFDSTNDSVLNENEYIVFVESLAQNTGTNSNANQNASSRQQRANGQQNQQRDQAQSASQAQQTGQQGNNKTASAGKKKPSEFAVREGQKSDVSNLSADELLDMRVVGKKSNEIGSVENLLINRQGQIVAVVAQVGGFLDIGDTHVAVPWNQASMKGGKLHLPITEDNAGDYSIFKEQYFSTYDAGTKSTVADDLSTGPSIWKATDLIDDYVLLENDTGYGYVTDLTFNQEGKLQSVVVNASNPDFDYGYFAYPWYGFGYDFGWDPGLNYYILPYSDGDLAGI